MRGRGEGFEKVCIHFVNVPKLKTFKILLLHKCKPKLTQKLRYAPWGFAFENLLSIENLRSLLQIQFPMMKNFPNSNNLLPRSAPKTIKGLHN